MTNPVNAADLAACNRADDLYVMMKEGGMGEESIPLTAEACIVVLRAKDSMGNLTRRAREEIANEIERLQNELIAQSSRERTLMKEVDMDDTPRTEIARLNFAQWKSGEFLDSREQPDGWQFARQLERELTAIASLEPPTQTELHCREHKQGRFEKMLEHVYRAFRRK